MAATSRRRRVAAVATAGMFLAGAGLSVGTNALFTDREVVDSNSFTSGVLDLAVGDQTRTVQAANMAPGDVEWAAIQLENSGDLDLQYTFTVSVSNDDSPVLAQALEARTLAGAAACDDDGSAGATALLDATGFPTADHTYQHANARAVAVGGHELLCLRIELPLESGDAYQGASSALAWTFHAEQVPAEAPDVPGALP